MLWLSLEGTSPSHGTGKVAGLWNRGWALAPQQDVHPAEKPLGNFGEKGSTGISENIWSCFLWRTCWRTWAMAPFIKLVRARRCSFLLPCVPFPRRQCSLSVVCAAVASSGAVKEMAPYDASRIFIGLMLSTALPAPCAKRKAWPVAVVCCC